MNCKLDKLNQMGQWKMKLKGNIVCKSKQAFAYADDILLIATDMVSLQEMLVTLDEKGKK